MSSIIYLDNNATTAVDDRVKEYMLPFFDQFYGNASGDYEFSKTSRKVLDYARGTTGQLIGCDENEVFFTSCGTESINLGLKGLALHPLNKKRHIITCLTEHKAVLETCNYLQSVGFDIEYLPVNHKGEIELEQLKNTIRNDTLLICLMWVNNETGVIHPIEQIGAIAKSYGVYFVCDGTQGIGKLPVNVHKCNVDIFCFSAHKVYAPKGVGGLFVNEKILRSNSLLPLIHGGGQEKSLRSGTYNIPLIAGMGKAFEIANVEMTVNRSYVLKLRDILESELLDIKGAISNGILANRIFNTINIYIPNLEVSVFLGLNKNIVFSTGSACNSALIQPSHVLTAMGVPDEMAMNSVRISLGIKNIEKEILEFMEKINKFIGKV